MLQSLSRFVPNLTPCGRTRREFLWQVGGGFAGLALVDLLSRDGFFGSSAAAESSKYGANPLAPKPTHFAAKAKHAVFLFMNGAPSHVDTFDFKPALTKFHGTTYRGDTPVGSNGRPIGYLMQTPFQFRKHGKSGADTVYKMGVAYENLGDFPRARKCYETVAAYEEHPLAPEAHSALSRLQATPQ